ncbi:hypothetical protein KKF61_06835 [Patescibacteria group bacterium]|nr:hypothetical protein [Patescibacteria group bacterium]MBU0963616.1 hypothetical protein [Patescibacteria group bacterium]
MNERPPEAKFNAENEPTPEQRLKQWQKEIIEKSGQRSIEESQQLMESHLNTLRRDRARHEGTISNTKNLADLKTKLNPEKNETHLAEGAVEYKQIENDASVICASDIHGSPEDLKTAVNDFLQRKSRGENVYFNYGGDFSSGPQSIEVIEMLSALKKQFPKEVSIVTGNAERRGASLVTGAMVQAAEKYSPELFKHLEILVEQTFARLRDEIEKSNGQLPDLSAMMKKGSHLYNAIFSAQLLRAGREAGTPSIKPEDLNPEVLYQIIKTTCKLKPDQQSDTLNQKILRPLVFARQGKGAMTSREDRAIPEQAMLDDEARKITEYWQSINDLSNEQPTHTVLENDNGIIVGAHAGYVNGVDELGQIVHDPVKAGEAGWNKLYPEGVPDDINKSIARYGDYHAYTEKDFGQHWGNLADPEKPLVVVVGHNHKNYSNEIPMTDSDGKQLNQNVRRVEVASGTPKNKEPKYVTIDTSKTGSEQAVEYKSTK